MEERVLTFKTLYQTSSFMTVQRYFLKKFNRRQICSQPSGTDAWINWQRLLQQETCGGKTQVSTHRG